MSRVVSAMTLLLFGVSLIVAIACWFAIIAGVIAVVLCIASVVAVWKTAGTGRRKAALGALLLNVVGIAFAAAATLLMMSNVNSTCGEFDPESPEGVACFQQQYSSSTGLQDLLFGNGGGQ
ncbi:hypothetical protein [Corynebacterium sp.]|uniref:hypothetical protein n=1 Tax=Corynebacterium sp. TaxID=1720 RepID=UPI0026DB9B1F|nr:hypothetical protein [Corynebacterium sp.]MDO5077202.1 hypothetical protein [Corynebacterium sp.]